MSPGLILAVALSLTNDYQRIGSERGVTVYKHQHESGISLAAEGDFAAPPDQVRRVLCDFGNHPRWNKNVKESRILSRGDDWLVVYQRLNLPMVSDRDYTARVSWGKRAGGNQWVEFHADNDDGPRPRGGVVRMSTYDGHWELWPIDGGRATRARYVFHMDLGGSLPGWMSRGRASKDVPHLFDQIRGQLRYY